MRNVAIGAVADERDLMMLQRIFKRIRDTDRPAALKALMIKQVTGLIDQYTLEQSARANGVPLKPVRKTG